MVSAEVTDTATGMDCKVVSRFVAVTITTSVSCSAAAAGAVWACATPAKPRPAKQMDESSAIRLILEVLFERMCVSPKKFFWSKPSKTGDWPLLSEDEYISVCYIVRLLAFNLQHAGSVFPPLDCKPSRVLPERRKNPGNFIQDASDLGCFRLKS
jgi:hypothetical protein